MSPNSDQKQKVKVNLIDAVLLGVGGMIGGGVFLLNGFLVYKNKQFSPFSWLVGLLICLTVVFSYILLSLEYPSNQGTIIYPEKLLENKNTHILIGLLIFFGYISLTAVYSVSLGEYVANYFNRPFLSNYIAICTIVFCQIINYFSEHTFLKMEDVTVSLKILLFLGLITVGVYLPASSSNLLKRGGGGIRKISQTVTNTNTFSNSIQSVIILGFAAFLSYEGFEMISDVSDKIENPKQNLPYAYILSVCIAFVIYFGITYVTNKHIGSHITRSNQFSSFINLTKSYGFLKYGPIVIIFLCALSNITAINSTIFTNNQIFENFVTKLKINKHIIQPLNIDIPLPFFREKRKLAIWIASIIAAALTFLPIIITTNLGSLSFLLIFSIISYLGFKLVVKKENEHIPIEILNRHIPYSVSKMITGTSSGLCILGAVMIVWESYTLIR